MSMIDWLKRQWRRIVPGQVTILNAWGAPTQGMAVDVSRNPTEVQISATKPSDETFFVSWRWAGLPLPGVTLERRSDYAITIHVAQGAPPGLGHLECVCTTALGVTRQSKPYFIRIVDPTEDSP